MTRPGDPDRETDATSDDDAPAAPRARPPTSPRVESAPLEERSPWTPPWRHGWPHEAKVRRAATAAQLDEVMPVPLELTRRSR